MRKVKNTIPVYDICSLDGHKQVFPDIIAEPFAPYLALHPNLHAPHRHSFYHIVLFTKGSGTHTIDFERFDVAEGEVYFMSPGQVHSWNFEGDTDGYVINFSESLLDSFLSNKQYAEQFSFFRSLAAESVINLPAPVYGHAKSIFEQVVQETQEKQPFATDRIGALLIDLFISVQRIVSAAAPPSVPPQNLLILHNFRKLVDAYYQEKRLPKEYAALLYITPNHLNALCKDLLGRSAGEVIRDRILLEAKRLLVNADLSISEIAFRLSFSDNSHFTKFFKKYTQATPEEFRKGFAL